MVRIPLPGQLTLFPLEKRCTKCGETKKFPESFYKNPACRDGHDTQCRSCKSQAHRHLRNAKEDILREQRTAKRAANPEYFRAIVNKSNKRHRDRRRTDNHRWYQANWDYVRITRERYRQEHLEKMQAYHIDYRKRHADKHRTYCRAWRKGAGADVLWMYRRSVQGKITMARATHARRTRMATLPNTLTGADWLDIMKEQGYACLICGQRFSRKLKPTIDHRIPVKHGGGLTRENCIALCGPCNSRKRDRPLEQYLPPPKPA